ncbi:MAG: hypothetical protein ACI4J0_04275 [Huintestinicola sp.]|uniref:hypothetical protein n=1 Tax=Huintestinicola sp. TaxID=2981661 RepID=UPI003EFF1680
MEDKTDMGYSALYSQTEEENDDKATALADYEQRELARKGKIKVMVIGILYLIFCGINILKAIPDLSEGLSYFIGEMAALVLFTAIGVMFIMGKNGARIALGVIFCISAAISLLILVPSLISTAAYGSMAVLFGVLSSLISLALIGVPIWFTLLDKSVKAYCKSKQKNKN